MEVREGDPRETERPINIAVYVQISNPEVRKSRAGLEGSRREKRMRKRGSKNERPRGIDESRGREGCRRGSKNWTLRAGASSGRKEPLRRSKKKRRKDRRKKELRRPEKQASTCVHKNGH